MAPGVELKPSEGSKRGQRFVGATGKTAPNVGQRRVEFSIAQGQDRACTFQCSDVNNMLACIAGIADGPEKGKENLITVSFRGGVVTPDEATTTALSEDKSLLTEFNRKNGMIYVMDACVRTNDAVRTYSGKQALKMQAGK